MPRRPARTKTAASEPAKGRRSTQRERIVAGMVASANRKGYAGAPVAAVVEQAQVSRPTFYEYFDDRDDCFLAAVVETADVLVNEVRVAVAQEPPERAVHAGISALVAFAVAEPALARFLTNEALAAGPQVLDARDASIAEIEQVVVSRHAELEGCAPITDFSTRMLVGGVYRLLATRLRRGEPDLPGMLDDLLSWIDSYAKPSEAHRWRTLSPTIPPAPSPYLSDAPLRAPAKLEPGHPPYEVAENHRQRILFAAARLAETKGYTATTVADMTRLAEVDARVFYSMFRDKQDAFMAVHEVGFQDLMAITAGAFFAGDSWPQRSWEAARAFAQFLEINPTVAHVGFVQAHAVGPGAVQRVEDSHLAFTIFLQEGYQNLQVRQAPSRLALEAIVVTVFEMVYVQARSAESEPRLGGLLGHLCFLVLAPFLGAAQADEFIAQKLAGTGA